MPTITLPDGSTKSFDNPVSGLDIAASIGPGLAKAALAMEVDGVQKDLSATIDHDASLRLFTAKDDEGLEILRHSSAHVLAQAVKEIYPDAQITIGPVIEHGFYYDISFKKAISSEELEKIEARMKDIIKADLPVERQVWERDEAVKYFKSIGEDYKAEIIADLPADEVISIYQQGSKDKGFLDLCRGPHVPSTGKLVAEGLKLTHLAGAYWRGDSSNEMLTRIYGVAFANKKELKAHLTMMEEAAKRDHRKIGPALDLFHMQEEAPGQVFWHDKGWTIFLELQKYIRDKLRAQNYQEVNTPQLIRSDLYVKSGHWDKFGTENMFVVNDEERKFAMKPMNCPCHVQIFNQGNKSYRDLPLRMSEFGTCMRNEAHGALHGLMRVTSMTQDDAHVFCTHEQIEQEVVILCELIKEIYADFGFNDVFVKFSDRPEMRVGSDEVWDHAEQALRNACDSAGLEWVLNPGEGAFYGPKLEFVLKDAIGRDWQCGTVQLDFNLPERLDAVYVDADGERKAPVMIHRALLGSLERFTGILIENYVGHFPLWLAPVQAVLCTLTDRQDDYVKKVAEKMRAQGLRVEVDTRNEKVNYKVREHSVNKVPLVLVAGDREVDNDTLTVRRLGSNKQQTQGVDEIITAMLEEIRSKAQPPQKSDEAAA